MIGLDRRDVPASIWPVLVLLQNGDARIERSLAAVQDRMPQAANKRFVHADRRRRGRHRGAF